MRAFITPTTTTAANIFIFKFAAPESKKDLEHIDAVNIARKAFNKRAFIFRKRRNIITTVSEKNEIESDATTIINQHR